MTLNSNIRTITPIEGTNGKFEYYQYNDDLKLIHSVEDDMFQAKSIIDSLGSKKMAVEWLRNKDTVNLLEGYKCNNENSHYYSKLIDKKEKINNIKFLKGIYIHRLLINNFASWIEPKYAYKIAILLDDKFEVERLRKENSNKQDKIDDLLRKLDEQGKKVDETNRKADLLIKYGEKQEKQIEELHNEVIDKANEIIHKENKIVDITTHTNNLIKRCDGLVLNRFSKDKTPLMIYTDVNNKKFDINDKSTYILHFHISRAQIPNMKRPDAIKAYKNGSYFTLIMLPASILVNVDVITDIKKSEFNYCLSFTRNTDMFIHIDKLLFNKYGEERYNRIINEKHSERYIYKHNIEGQNNVDSFMNELKDYIENLIDMKTNINTINNNI